MAHSLYSKPVNDNTPEMRTLIIIRTTSTMGVTRRQFIQYHLGVTTHDPRYYPRIILLQMALP